MNQSFRKPDFSIAEKKKEKRCKHPDPLGWLPYICKHCLLVCVFLTKNKKALAHWTWRLTLIPGRGGCISKYKASLAYISIPRIARTAWRNLLKKTEEEGRGAGGRTRRKR